MAKIDRIKEHINYMKVWLGIFVVTLIGLVGWFISNYETISQIKVSLSILSIVIMAILIHILNKKILDKINSLEEL